MTKKIGYFIPEFPGQTHMFFWREMQALDQLGVELDVVSTRLPPTEIMSHTWATEAQARTNYLFPLSPQKIIKIILELIRCGPIAWYRCLKSIVEAEGLSLSGRLRLLALVLIGAELSDLAKTNKWQHLHVHFCADAAHIAMFAFLLSNLSYSMTLHAQLAEYGPNQKQKWRWTKWAIVISKKLYEEVHQKLAGFLPPKIVVAPMGVNLTEIKRNSPYKPYQVGQNPCRLFSCGRLNVVKGHKYLIETVKILREQGFDIELSIAGEDEQGGAGYRQELERIIQENSLNNYVKLLGAVSEAKVRQELELAHIFTLASLNEGVPVAVMEAMAMEMPVVVTNVGGNSELIDDGVDAIMVEAEKPLLMAEAITRILQNPDIAMGLSQKSRSKIETKFSHKISAQAIFDQLQLQFLD